VTAPTALLRWSHGALPVSIIVGTAVVLGLALDPVVSLGLVGSIKQPPRGALAVGVVLFGLWLARSAIRTTDRTVYFGATPIESSAPSPHPSPDHIYLQSRNPLYLGVGIVGFGTAVFLGSDCAILMLIPAALIVHFGLVLREERRCERAFGDGYRDYAARVPRYGVPAPRRSADSAPVMAPAPLIVLAVLLAGLVLDRIARPSNGIDSVPGAITIPLAVLMLLMGAAIMFRAVAAFRRAETHLSPHLPSRALAFDDIYSRTRNPFYQAMGIMLVGVALALRSDWTLLLLIPAALVVHYGVVMREERYLEQKFGDEYRRYRDAVPRYGLPWSVAKRGPERSPQARDRGGEDR
jgi:protein-S-isoprenylcysteine O-methyltransferase Ste14